MADKIFEGYIMEDFEIFVMELYMVFNLILD